MHNDSVFAVDITKKIDGKYVFTPIEQENFALLKEDFDYFFELFEKHRAISKNKHFYRSFDMSEDSPLFKLYYTPELSLFFESFESIQENLLIQKKDTIILNAVRKNLYQAKIDFLILHFERMEFRKNHNDLEMQIELCKKAMRCVERNPYSTYNDYINETFGTYEEPSNFGFGYSINANFIGLHNYFQQNFHDNISKELELKIVYHNFVFGFGITATDLNPRTEAYQFGEWLVTENYYSIMFFMNLNVGRDFDLFRNRITLRPKIGYSRQGFNSTLRDEHPPGDALYEHYSRKTFNPYFGMDILWNWEKNKRFQTHFAKINRKLKSYSVYFRMGFGYLPKAIQQFDSELPYDVYIISLGFGGYMRGNRKVPSRKLL